MHFLSVVIDTILHIDVYLESIIQAYQAWTYALLFLVILCETGLVVTPFLPGDSLLFAAGAFAATHALEIYYLFPIVFLAAAIGDTLNYHIGKYVGPRIFRREQSWFFHPEHLEKARLFYKKHGGKTIVLARFIPIMRTFAPFVAGIGRMDYVQFLGYNIAGAFIWSVLFIFGGFFFGTIPFVQENFSVVIIAIIIISCIPLIREAIHHNRTEKNSKQQAPAE